MKIALIGSAPSSVALAPYDDESWTIWACSPGAYCHLKRVDRFFELHRFLPDNGDWTPGYLAWLKGLAAPIYMIEPSPEFPTSVAYPKAEMLERWGHNFFTSTLAWMTALALAEIETAREKHIEHVMTCPGDEPVDLEPVYEIGFWGVDMAATEEYGLQKPGCLYFIEKARELGIKVTLPPESDLDRPLPLYGIGEANPMRIKLMTRRAELTAKRDSCAQDAANLQAQWEAKIREQAFFQGALDDNQYMLNTWCE